MEVNVKTEYSRNNIRNTYLFANLTNQEFQPKMCYFYLECKEVPLDIIRRSEFSLNHM